MELSAIKMCYCNPLLEKKIYFSCKHLLTRTFLCHFALECRVSWERQETQRKCSEKNWRGQWIIAHEVVIFKEIWLLHQFNPLSPSIHIQILQTYLHTFLLRISWENLIKHQGIFSFVIIFYILTTLSLDNVWTLLGENCCWSLLGLKGLRLSVNDMSYSVTVNKNAIQAYTPPYLLMRCKLWYM